MDISKVNYDIIETNQQLRSNELQGKNKVWSVETKYCLLLFVTVVVIANGVATLKV